MWIGFLTGWCFLVGMPDAVTQVGLQVVPRFLSKEALQKWMVRQWEERRGTVHALHVEFQMTRKLNHLNGLTRQYEGTADYLRLPSGMTAARIRYQELDPLTGQSLPDKVDEFVMCGSTFFMSSARDKQMWVMHLDRPLSYKHPLVISLQPLIVLPSKPNWTEEWAALNPFFGAFIGIDPEQLQQGVKMQITRRDSWYTYADFRPLRANLAQEFTYARVVYMNQALGTPERRIPAHFPRQLYWVEPNKNETTWDIRRVEVNQPALSKPFNGGIPELPKGWEVQQVTCDPLAPFWGLRMQRQILESFIGKD